MGFNRVEFKVEVFCAASGEYMCNETVSNSTYVCYHCGGLAACDTMVLLSAIK